jgi:hypothetical protein
MTGRINWARCKLRDHASESKYGSGVVLDNGARTPTIRKDSLAQQADRAMRNWLRTVSQRDRERFAK